jgi:hypothetical protein
MHEVNIQTIDMGQELGKTIEASFLCSPVKGKSPMADQALHKRLACAIVPTLFIHAVGQTSQLKPSPQVVELSLGYGDLEWSNTHQVAFTSLAAWVRHFEAW